MDYLFFYPFRLLLKLFIIFTIIYGFITSVFATRIWENWETEKHLRTFQPIYLPPPPEIQIEKRFNYLMRIKKTLDFIASLQISDSSSPNFGGIIEGEHLPNIIETDNTQEAIWCFSRWFELTGMDTYRINIRRAWHYVNRFPAYREGGAGAEYYAVWNCGLALFCEQKYRDAYQDSSYQPYIDTCLSYLYAHPLPFTNNLNAFVTSFAAGMLYIYGKLRNNQQAIDTALIYAQRVKIWIEQNPRNLQSAFWAMSGGTALWGVANSYCREDTINGKIWLLTYGDSLPFFIPSGQWNNSWNIWIANAYKSIYEITHERRFITYHHYLMDTLLFEDRDDDGGIPATFAENPDLDQTWISSYLDFMAMDFYAAPTFDYDAGALRFLSPEKKRIYLTGDTIPIKVIATNYGKRRIPDCPLRLRGELRSDTTLDLNFLDLDTISFPNFIPDSGGIYSFSSFTDYPDEERRENDTAIIQFKVYSFRNLRGRLLDSFSSRPVRAKILGFLFGSPIPFDSATTDTLTGQFTLTLFDTTFIIKTKPLIPYPNKEWLVCLIGDTNINFLLPPAHLLIVNDDPQSFYENYYTSTLDTLGLTYCLWQRNVSGPLPISCLSFFRTKTIIWYTGNALSNTLDSIDQDSIRYFLENSGNLLLTGQNIAQDLQGTEFLSEVLKVRFGSDSVSGYYIAGNREDSLGRQFTITATAGTGGANNQRSRDELIPEGEANSFLTYDTLQRKVAGIYFREGDAKVIFLGFGFEAINRPASRPNYMTRVEFLRKLLNFFNLTAITEMAKESRKLLMPTILKGQNGIKTLIRPRQDEFLIYDISGKMIFPSVNKNKKPFLPAGIYILKTKESISKIIYLP
ncbi:MAG: hypothetical protein ABIK81_00580 [candidate division WOR-3 bacterium]